MSSAYSMPAGQAVIYHDHGLAICAFRRRAKFYTAHGFNQALNAGSANRHPHSANKGYARSHHHYHRHHPRLHSAMPVERELVDFLYLLNDE